MEVSTSLKYVILLFLFSPGMNLTLILLLIKNVASSFTLLFSFIAKLYNSLNLKACGVCVNSELFLLRLNIWFLILYLIESFEKITGSTALFFF